MGEILRALISASFLHGVVLAMAPLLLGGQGELVIERSGILNLAIAGMFPLAGASAFVTSYAVGGGVTGMLLGFLAGAMSGIVIALLLGVFCITLRGNQITVGLTLFMLSLGASEMVYRLVVGVSTQTKSVSTLSPVGVPGLAGLPFVGQVLSSQTYLVYAALLLTPVVAYILFRTPVGRRLRAVGENPRCVDGLGISVFKIRYAALALGGALIGIGGASLPLAQLGSFSSATLVGQGWLALMLVIFGKWKPWRVFVGALLFAYVLALQFTFAVLLPAIPTQMFLMLPYVLAVLVLIRTSVKGGGPAALTLPFAREARV